LKRNKIPEISGFHLLKQAVTNMVPATRVLMWLFSSSSSLANPKSDILGFRFPSSSTFVALMSL
jgi:hypothetical protein